MTDDQELVATLRAYHGDPAIKRKYLRRVRAHVKADELVQGYGYWRDGKGCALGCTVHRDKKSTPHARYPIELGIPEELAYLEDHFFERLPVELARKWPTRFLSAINVGADLSRVFDYWSAWNMIDPEHGVITLVSDDYPEIQRIVRETGQACLDGDRINSARAAEAECAAETAWAAARAAWSADSAEAADAAEAAGAADAAWAAGAADAAEAVEAADAAEAARAARAAWSARAAGAARDGYYAHASDKLIELLKAAS